MEYSGRSIFESVRWGYYSHWVGLTFIDDIFSGKEAVIDKNYEYEGLNLDN